MVASHLVPRGITARGGGKGGGHIFLFFKGFHSCVKSDGRRTEEEVGGHYFRLLDRQESSSLAMFS